MPRKKQDNGGGEGNGGAAAAANVIVGKYKDPDQQKAEAAGEEKAADPVEEAKKRAESTTGNTDEAAQARDEADPERKARSVVIAAAQELWKEFPETNPYVAAGFPTKPTHGEGQLYSGWLTLHSVNGETFLPVDIRIHLDGAMSEEGVFRVLQAHEPSATREQFEIDHENKTAFR